MCALQIQDLNGKDYKVIRWNNKFICIGDNTVYFRNFTDFVENTTQLAKYPHVLYAKPSNKVYVFTMANDNHFF